MTKNVKQDLKRAFGSLNGGKLNTDLGSVHRAKSFIIHLDEIKLGKEEAFFMSKVEGFYVDKIMVKYI